MFTTLTHYIQSQEASNEKLKVFIEGKTIDFDYIRRNTTFVNFVNDPKVSEIHIIISRQSTGGGGFNFSFDFIGSENITIPSFKLSCYTLSYDTDEVIRKKLVKTLHSGLLPYVNQKNGIDDLKVIAIVHKINDGEKKSNSETSDPWRQWVFSLSTDFGFEGEESKRNFEYGIFGRFAKINDKWKIINKYGYEKSKEIIKKDSGEVVESLRIEQEVDLKLIYSLNSHWSTAFFFEGNQNTFLNLKMSLKALPAIQYNFYDWSKSNKKQLTFSYFVGPVYNDYYETTIFNKGSEWIWKQNFGIALNKTETWGKIFAWLKGGHFISDFKKYSVNTGINFEIRVTKGLSLFFTTQAKSVHDQIYLPNSELSEQDLLLNNRKLPSTFEYYGKIGIRFQFGSIYNNIVNERF